MSRPKQQFCVNGHNTFITGRIGYSCTICLKENGKKRTELIRKSLLPRSKKQICKNGHDTFVTGRTKDGHCFQCVEDRKAKLRKGGQKKVQFCPRGHDTFICGRTDSYCNICKVERMKEWQDKNEIILIEKRKRYYIDNRELILKKKHETYVKDYVKKEPKSVLSPEELKKRQRERAREYRRTHKEQFRAYEAKRNAKRLKTNIKYKI